MRRWIAPAFAVSAALVMAACSPGANQGSPELRSLFTFTAYPGGKLVSENVWGNNLGPFPMAGNQGIRTYQVTDSPSKVAEYYRGLASKNNWKFDSPSTVESGGTICSLEQGRFHVSIVRDWVENYVPPTPPPMGSPDPSATPVPASSPTPRPEPSGPYNILINASVY